MHVTVQTEVWNVWFADVCRCTYAFIIWIVYKTITLDSSWWTQDDSEAIAFFTPRPKPLAPLPNSIQSISVAGSSLKLQSLIKWNKMIRCSSGLMTSRFLKYAGHHTFNHALHHIWSLPLMLQKQSVCLDYCNSFFAGASALNLSHLQLVQDTLACVVAQKPRHCHITPVLIDLHWFTVYQQIGLKIATTAFKVLHYQQPSLPCWSACSQTTLLHSLRFFLQLPLPSLHLYENPRLYFQNHFPHSHPTYRTNCPVSTLPAFRKHPKSHFILQAHHGSIVPATPALLTSDIIRIHTIHIMCSSAAPYD